MSRLVLGRSNSFAAVMFGSCTERGLRNAAYLFSLPCPLAAMLLFTLGFVTRADKTSLGFRGVPVPAPLFGRKTRLICGKNENRIKCDLILPRRILMLNRGNS